MTIAAHSLPFNHPAHPAYSLANGQRLDQKMLEGRQFEMDFFGFSPVFDPEEAHRTRIENIPLMGRVAQVIELQPSLSWDPRKPATAPAKRLFDVVNSKLPNQTGEIACLYCSLGTPLDWLFGVDGFFVLDSNPNGPITFNLARSKGWFQRRKLKANLLVTPEDLVDARIHAIGWKVSTNLLKSLKRKDGRSTRRRI